MWRAITLISLELVYESWLDCFDGRPEDGLYAGIGGVPAHPVAAVSIDVVCLAFNSGKCQFLKVWRDVFVEVF